ncbi:MAG TPA: hypothetical protein VHW09_26840 [Bryobacteraceae bacterium]|jgi:hypothetical protein|nr:hypothetical protein [Bryobacteraceae bacterium]
MTDFEDAPKVSLGGKDWPIPLMAARQNRVIDPLILNLLPLFAELQVNKAAGMAKLGTKEYDALQDIALHAIRRARPETTKDQFLDLPITLPELVAAFPIIAQQTGIFKRGEPGEATGAVSPQTGTESLQTSAT